MATRAQKTKVGLFVVACAVLIAAGLITISGYKHEERTRYWIQFDESLLGLGTGGLVEYMGVDIGAVDDIYVTEDNKAHVEILIRPSKVTLREGVSAKLVLYSIATGTMCVELEGGDAQGKVLPPGSEIPAEKSLVEAVSSKVESIVDNLAEIADAFNRELQGLEEGELSHMTQHIHELVSDAQQFLEDTQSAIQDLRGDAGARFDDFKLAIDDVRAFVRDMDETATLAREKLEKLEVGRTEANVNKVLEDISKLSERLQESTAAFDNVARAAVHEAGNVEYNLRETMRTLNESLEAVRQLANYLQQDPSALVRGRGKPTGGR